MTKKRSLVWATRHVLGLPVRAVCQQSRERVEEARRMRCKVAAQVARKQPCQAAQRVQAQRRLRHQARQQQVHDGGLMVHQQRQRGAEGVRG